MAGRFYKYFFYASMLYALIHRVGTRGSSTDEEVDGSLPGDQIVPHPMLETTHAVTINAAPAAVWPWLMQGGYGRAGWYTDAEWYKSLEKLALPATVPAGELHVGRLPRSPRTILPEFQNVKVGDIIPDGPPGSAWFTVVELEENRTYALHSNSHIRYLTPTFLRGTAFAASGDFSWTFVLAPLQEGSTRLILRTRATILPRLLKPLVQAPFYLLDYLIVRELLHGVKSRVEATTTATATA